MCLLLVNLLLLASLEERSTHRKLDCFLEVGDEDGLEEDNLADEATGDGFALFWGAVALLVEKALSLLLEVRLESFFFHLPSMVAFVVIFSVIMINGHHQSVYILEQGGFSLFLSGDRIQFGSL